MPFFLVYFHDPVSGDPVCADPRGLLRKVAEKATQMGFKAKAGVEYEFYNFSESAESLVSKSWTNLNALTPGMFGYSLQRPTLNQDYFDALFDQMQKFRINVEALHTETGPGVIEAALLFDDALEMADRAALFKLASKQIGSKQIPPIIPTFMAKPHGNLPGTSGHTHISLIDLANGNNAFANTNESLPSQWKDEECLSKVGRFFLAGVLAGLPDIMPLMAPTINSYKRLVENFWAPVTLSWGFENRIASVRVIGPPTASVSATRLEIRVPGADMHPHYTIAALLALGLRGIEKELDIPIDPVNTSDFNGERLPKSLFAATERFMAKDSLAREVLGNEFVDHFGGTRQHELREWY